MINIDENCARSKHSDEINIMSDTEVAIDQDDIMLTQIR